MALSKLMQSLSIICALAAAPVYAQEADVQAKSEIAPGALEFDFLIGHWDIFFRRFDPESGEILMELNALQTANYVGNRQMIVDEWTGFDQTSGEQVSHGVTLRTYSATARQWTNVYLESEQTDDVSQFQSRWIDGEMHAQGSSKLLDGRTLNYRLRFFEIQPDSFEWKEEWSINGGKSWHLVKTQSATRQ